MAECLPVDVRQASLQNGRRIYDLITANNLDGIRALLNPLTLRHRHSIVSRKVSNKTLLGHACELRFRNIVKYLLDECEADISESYPFRETLLSPLRVSISNVDVSMLCFLIRRGAIAVDKLEARSCANFAFNYDYFVMESILDRCIHKKKSQPNSLQLSHTLPLDINMDLQDPEYLISSSRRGDVYRLKTLLIYGARAKGTNLAEENALCCAIINKQQNAEHFLLNYRIFTLTDRVRALELSGSMLIALNSDFETGVLCWRKSLRIRNEHYFGVSDKFANKVKTGLGPEFICEQQLEKLNHNDAELCIQALIVLVRLLSPNSDILHNAFVNVAKHSVFQKDLLKQINILAELAKMPYVPVSGCVDPVQRSLEVLDFLVRLNFQSDPSNLSELFCKFRKLIDFISGVNWNVLLRGTNDFYPEVFSRLLLLVLRNLIAIKSDDLYSEEKTWIKDSIKSILQYQSDPYPTSLLHLAVEDPSASSVLPFILSCSDNVNCTDNQKSTPMHSVSHRLTNNCTLLGLVKLLTDAGGHIDAVNKFNRTPFSILKNRGVIQNPLTFLSLQCLAAQTIHKYNIKVPEMYPKKLVTIIKIHSTS